MSLVNLLILSGTLFAIGAYGMLTRRNLIALLMSIEIMLNAAVINFIAFARFSAQDASAGTIFSVFIIAVAACEMAVALAIVVMVNRRRKTTDITQMSQLHG